MECIMVFITAANHEEGQKIARKLVEEKLVACVNAVSEISSLYWWQNKIESTTEVLLVAKTVRPNFDKVISRVKALHSYTVPEIIALPIIAGNPEYMKWIEDSVKS